MAPIPYEHTSIASTQRRDNLATSATTSTARNRGFRFILGPLMALAVVPLCFTAIGISHYVPDVPDVNVLASAQAITRLSLTSAQASSLRIALIFSNKYYSHTLSFHNVTLSLPGGGGLIPHPPFQVSGLSSSLIRFRLDNATLSVDSSSLATLRVELAAVGQTRRKVWWGIRKEGWVRARCGPMKVSLNNEMDDDDATCKKTEGDGCKSSGLWKGKQVIILWGSVLGCGIWVCVIFAFGALYVCRRRRQTAANIDSVPHL